jgi:hypothetical protein
MQLKKSPFLIIFLFVFFFFFVSVKESGEGGSGGVPSEIRFLRASPSQFVTVDFYYSFLEIEGGSATSAALPQDFTLTINGSNVTVLGNVGIMGSSIRLAIGNVGESPTYTAGTVYTIRVVYTANASRRILCDDKALGSFSIERSVPYTIAG